MNVEYDHIRDILMKDEEIWERFKYMYSVKKLHKLFLPQLEELVMSLKKSTLEE